MDRPPMMEYALRLETPLLLPPDPRQWCAAAWGDRLPEGRLAALYFGTEFCEDRLPAPGEAEAFCALAARRGLEAVLLTPVLRPAGLARLDALLTALQAWGRFPAVVCNDWGAWRLVRDGHPRCARRGGRLLNRGLRDPRALEAGASGVGAGAAGGERSRLLRDFLREGGAAALETDPDLEGGFLGGAGGLQRTLHLPFAFVTSGRHCLGKAAAAATPRGGPFAGAVDAPCCAPCRRGPSREERDDTPVPLWRAGNTLFYEVPEPLAAAHLAQADRVVLHRRPAP
ncbi:MAG: hypothetical protein AB1578_10735 [Thermodesulfobacteriota bacterium]